MGSFLRSLVHKHAEFLLSVTETRLSVEGLGVSMQGLVPALLGKQVQGVSRAGESCDGEAEGGSWLCLGGSAAWG